MSAARENGFSTARLRRGAGGDVRDPSSKQPFIIKPHCSFWF
jgi:hypothetical protein